MTATDTALCWSRRFGLASAPLFEIGEAQEPGIHHVLLDGGHGTFALSVSPEELWRTTGPAEWAWSSDIPHHVTLTDSVVGVMRWDRLGEPQVFRRPSVERDLDGFYAYLVNDRVRSNKTVVEHLLGLFRRLRSLAHAANLPDEKTTEIFTAALAALVAPDVAPSAPTEYGLSDDAFDLLGRLDRRGRTAAEDEIMRASGSLSMLRLHPALAIRHAGGQLFQEAHFELLKAPASPDLWGLLDAPVVKPANRGDTHYTPPALARSVVEQALCAIGDVASRGDLTVCDPACGSGAFLHEALRAVRRVGFRGRLRLIGQDISAPAVAMARFALRAALHDWTPDGGAELVLSEGDSLGELGIPPADLIVMNPPFISFGMQTPKQREQVREATGGAGGARADYSMAFVLRALAALRDGGALGTIVPASLLSLKAAGPWRERLAEAGDVRLLASIGEFGLFAQALVQVACLVVARGPSSAREFTALVTENDARATGDALRCLRRNGLNPPALPVIEDGWSIFAAPTSELKRRPTWRFPSPSSARLLQALNDAQLPLIGQLFDVAQGIQTGLNEVLLLTEGEWRALPSRERAFFRAATMSDSIRGGRIERPYYVFFPHTADGPLFRTEDELRRAAPHYFRHRLEPNRDRLTGRASIVRARRKDWWGLMHARERTWSCSKQPRIISKFFAAEGGFAGDYEAAYVAVMGHVWLPRAPLAASNEEEDLSDADVLASYVAMFNSGPFIKILSLYSPHVAGGQYDLSLRHVEAIPVPNLRELSIDPQQGRAVVELAGLGRAIALDDPIWRARTTQLVGMLYGSRVVSDL